MNHLFKKKRVLVTGAAGTIGCELIKQILEYQVEEVRAIDNNESELFFLSEFYRNENRINGFFGDIRDSDRLNYICKDVDIILHTAALKHVMISELSPLEAERTNVGGTSNVIEAALNSERVSRVIYTSSDKAVNPTNVMGTTKLLGERLVTSALNIRGGKDVVFSSTRFGNVIGSKGSVVHIFYRQIKEGKNITVTDNEMTRFIMTISDAARLVLKATLLAKGGEVFVTKMPVIRIADLATAMIRILAPKFGRKVDDINVEIIGKKPGEKLYEELMTDEETSRALELQDLFVVKPAFPPIYDRIDYESYDSITNRDVINPYVSANEAAMTVDDLVEFLQKNDVLSNIG